MSYHESLGVSRADFEALAEHFQERVYEGRRYRALPDARRSLERGTALLDGVVVRGFPKVPRTFVLETGVPRHFDGPFVVEEKLNGYNVRAVRVEGEVLAFTRGGLICPFTTWAVRDRLPVEAYFDAHPESMLCAEAIGPENPYTAHDYPAVESLAFRVFDLRDRTTGEPLPVAERRERCAAFDLPAVRQFGTYRPEGAAAELRSVVDGLDAENREGVVMKSLDGSTLLKYTTSAANRGDLAYAFSVPFDYGRDFVFRRLVREAFQSVEWDEDEATRAERARAVGEAILEPMAGTFEAVADGDLAGERHTVRGPPAVVDALLAHLREQGIHVVVEADAVEAGERVVTYLKRMAATTDRTRAYLDGAIVRE
ncbi:RNA ligase [Halomarina pelagica]|uniref:RNA ligase n=1 Tax=Halomarina pelagica TaxID=2961599 RepID=UPI0020C2F48F|nr:RNA ligase [Halomarina sp. BND7]